jgi:signal transduction histidine kinase
VDLRIHISDDDAEKNPVYLDYKMFNLAMHHFMNNAVKYAKPYSKISISFNFKDSILSIVMMSVKIDKDEIKEIFKLGVSGKNVGTRAGDGVGMFMIDKALTLLGAKMNIHPDYMKHETVHDTHFTENTFLIFISNKNVIKHIT